MSALDLAGVLIPAATPFDPVTGEIDVVGMRSNIRAWLSHAVLGVVVGGSTGEAVFLDEEERRLREKILYSGGLEPGRIRRG